MALFRIFLLLFLNIVMSVTDPRHVSYQGRSSFLLNKLRKFYFEEKPVVVSLSLMNKQFNLMLFVAWLVFNSESFELDFCPFFVAFSVSCQLPKSSKKIQSLLLLVEDIIILRVL